MLEGYLIFIKSSKLLYLEIASGINEKIIGLMYRKTLRQDSGMLFIYDDYNVRSLWMRNTYIPLDILFIRDNKIVDIKENNKILSDDPIVSDKKCNFVLEVNSNYVKKNNINIGDYINIVL